ncbi:MAG: nucleoside-triphosphatase [Anaerolineae bacterium]
MIVLLAGPVGVGKTTVAERVAGLARRQGLKCAGLLSPALKDGCGQKVGIWGADVATSARRLLARTDRDLGGPAVGIYSFDAQALDWAVAVVDEALGAADLVFVDEIGKLELWRDEGLAPVLSRLALGAPGHAVVLVRESLLAELQARLETAAPTLFQVTEANRDEVPGRVLAALWPGDENQSEPAPAGNRKMEV